MKKQLLCLVALLSIKMCWADNTLYKVFHHRGTDAAQLAKDAFQMELGSVVLYFDQKPIINALPERTDGKKEKNVMKLTFFLPKTSVNGDTCKKMIDRLHHTKQDGYNVQLYEVTKPIHGIKVMISYNSAQVSFAYDEFESIGLQKGLIFRFYNKGLLHKLNKKGALLLRTAHLKKKDPLLFLTLDMVGMIVAPKAILV